MKRVDPCDTCANRPGCETKFYERGCHYYPAWGSPAFDRIRDRAREAGKDQRREPSAPRGERVIERRM